MGNGGEEALSHNKKSRFDGVKKLAKGGANFVAGHKNEIAGAAAKSLEAYQDDGVEGVGNAAKRAARNKVMKKAGLKSDSDD